jgi:hypothetical protein
VSVQFNKLWTPHLIRGLLTRDPIITQAMTTKDIGSSVLTFTLAAMDAPLFVLDSEEAGAAIASAGVAPDFGLPPLPYKRVVLEGQPSGLRLRNEKGAGLPVIAVVVAEVATGEQWEVWALSKRGVDLFAGRWKLNASGAIELGDERFGKDTDFYRLPVEAIHLINAKGVTTEERLAPRAERRRFVRGIKAKRVPTYPTVFVVTIGGEKPEPGESENVDRVYTCRWLVRGHWRQLKSKRTWVRSHIKGPAGAPWRGYATYDVKPDTEVETAA